MASKYKYEGIELDNYCHEHGLNVDTQRRRIRKYIREHPGISPDDATKFVLDNRSRVIYRYNGIPLADYCRENNICYYTIVRRIESLQKKDPKLSNDEATRIAVEEFQDSRIKYIYEGKTLEEYCNEHGLNADTQRNRIKLYADEHPKLPIEDVMKTVFSTCGMRFYKYGYDGKSLADYCRENNLNYDTMVSRVERIKKQYPELSDDEATRIAVEEFTDRGIKYFYDGIPLIEYCRLHPEYNYISIRVYIIRKRKKYPKASTQEIIDSYFLVEHRKHNYHFVDGIPLYDYCEQKGIVYNSIIQSLCRMRRNSRYITLSEQERLEIALENYRNYVGCYLYYKGITLFTYCKENNYSYNTVYNYIFSLIKQHSDITLEEAMEIAFSNINRYGIKYYYHGEPLITYCREVGLNEKNVRNRATDYLNRFQLSMEEAIEESVSYYKRKKYYVDLQNIFYYLKNHDSLEEEILKEILDFLNIDEKNVSQLLEIHNHLSDVIAIIWYFHDNEDGEKLSISINSLRNLFKKVEELKTTDESQIFGFDILFLIGIYKANLFDSRYHILLHQERYHFSRIRSFMIAYGFKIKEDLKNELNSNLNLRLLEIVDKNFNNNVKMVMSYINKSINGYLSSYFVKYKKECEIVSLEAPISPHSSDKKLRLIDKIASPDPVDKSDEFSRQMISLLEELTEQERKYVFYKFQFCLSDEEIGALLEMDLEELTAFSKNILLKMRNSERIKSFML